MLQDKIELNRQNLERLQEKKKNLEIQILQLEKKIKNQEAALASQKVNEELKTFF